MIWTAPQNLDKFNVRVKIKNKKGEAVHGGLRRLHSGLEYYAPMEVWKKENKREKGTNIKNVQKRGYLT